MKSFWKHFFLDNGDIALIEAGVQKYIPNQINNYKVKHDFVFHLVLDGAGFYQANGKHHELKAQDGFVLKKNERVYYAPINEEPWTICWIGFGGNNIHKYLESTRFIQEHVFTFQEDSELYNKMIPFIGSLTTINLDQVTERLWVYSNLYEILSLINRELHHKEENSAFNYDEGSFAESIYEYIYSNFLDNITIKSVANHFDISRNYLFKVMKNYYGQSPKQIIQELRMNQASQLLRGTELKVNEIAAIIGYNDPFVFSKMFKNYYGHSPSQFRQLSEESIDEALFIRDKFLRVSPQGRGAGADPSLVDGKG